MLLISNIFLQKISDMKKNRENTEKKIIDAAYAIIERDGFESLGINAVAKEAQVSKVLIYRYFNSLEGLITRVISANDFWKGLPSLPINEMSAEGRIKDIFYHKALLLKENTVVRKFYRWRLVSENARALDIKSEREERGWEILYKLCAAIGITMEDSKKIATIINYAIDHIAITYDIDDEKGIRGLNLHDDNEWASYLQCIEDTIDLLLRQYKKDLNKPV